MHDLGRISRYSAFVLILLNLTWVINCQMLVNGKEMTTGEGESKAIGVGIDTDRETALNKAFEDAIKLTVGSLVASATVIENDKLIKDEIISLSKGFVSKYRIISEEHKDGKYFISISALVVEKQIYTSLQAKGIEVAYSTSGLFAQMDNFKRMSDKEYLFASSYIKNLLLLKAEPYYDYSIEISDPVVDPGLKDENGKATYRIPIEIRATLNKNYFNIIKYNIIRELSFDSQLLPEDTIKKLYLTARKSPIKVGPLTAPELNFAIKEGGLDPAYPNNFYIFGNKGYTPWLLCQENYSSSFSSVAIPESQTVYKFYNKETILLIGDYIKSLLPFTLPEVKVEANDYPVILGEIVYRDNSLMLELIPETGDNSKKICCAPVSIEGNLNSYSFSGPKRMFGSSLYVEPYQVWYLTNDFSGFKFSTYIRADEDYVRKIQRISVNHADR